MSLAICILMTWLVIVIYSFIPKKLLERDMVFVFAVNTIFELSLFTIFHVNLKWFVVSHSVEKSFADLVLRLIMSPLVFVMTANILLYSWRYLKWIIVILINLSFLLVQQLVTKLGILSINHWNWGYTLLLFSSYTIFSSFMAWLIKNVDEKEVMDR